MAGKIILVHGASSAGKSTLCAALQAQLPEPFWHYSIDHLIAAKVLPRGWEWARLREPFFEGFHRTLPALAAAGNNLLVEHIVETEAWQARLASLLAPFDLFYVALHCPLDELERRERERGDRPIGDARRDFALLERFQPYDLELDSTLPAVENAAWVRAAWEARTTPSAFFRRNP